MSKIYVDEILPKDNATVDGSKLSGLVSSAMPTGSIVQVVNATRATATSTNSTSFVTTGLSLSITPQSANNKILIMTSGDQYSGTDNLHQYQTIYRNGVDLGSDNQGLSLYSAGDNSMGRWSPAGITYLDSPNTTNSVTYEIYFRTSSSGGTTYFILNSDHPHRLILMEIAG